MRKGYLIPIGIILILLFIAIVGSINAVITGLIVATLFLIFMAIFAFGEIVGYFSKEDPYANLAVAVIILALSIAGLIVLWTVVAHHPWLYPHLKSAGII